MPVFAVVFSEYLGMYLENVNYFPLLWRNYIHEHFHLVLFLSLIHTLVKPEHLGFITLVNILILSALSYLEVRSMKFINTFTSKRMLSVQPAARHVYSEASPIEFNGSLLK